MLFENTVFEPDNVGGDPGSGPSHPGEAAMRYNIVAFCDDDLILVVQRIRHCTDEIEKSFATRCYVCAVLDVVR
jgi:hypothetical protein